MTNAVSNKMKNEEGIMDDAAIEAALNASDVEFSGDEDELEYLPPDSDGPSSSQSEEEQALSEEEQANDEVFPSLRQFWRTKEMVSRGPDISEDILLTNCLFSFFEYLDIDFWKETAEQTNLYSAQTRDLRTVRTNHREMIQFTGMQILMGTLKYPQARLYWSRDLSVPLIKDTRRSEIRKRKATNNNVDSTNKILQYLRMKN
ncbi:unnamed protein product [Leptidea sinapis]|uniref:PiggyBac transposable element-derived protein domain-containing protein n=1 Tax=Leptidea sinapis TaxID=189913 RepID=A0A5E4Q0W5_9NEOP|nr:unnamed protein product [Leptidea sinapis]